MTHAPSAIGEAAVEAVTTASEAANRLYHLVRDLEPGQDPQATIKTEIDDLIEVVENDPIGRPLEDPTIFDNWQVSYVSTARATKQEGQPAGGRFRGRIGRLIFRLTELCQSAISPNIITNKLGFTLLGMIRGSVGLRGTFDAVGDAADTVQVSFQPPVLSLGNNVHLRIGPTSSVILTTTWLDERLRLGKGSRGSRFVFMRGGYANSAGMNSIGQRSTSASGYTALLLALSGLTAATFALAAKPLLLTRTAAVLLGLLAGAVGFVVFRGGQFSQPPSAQPTSK